MFVGGFGLLLVTQSVETTLEATRPDGKYNFWLSVAWPMFLFLCRRHQSVPRDPQRFNVISET